MVTRPPLAMTRVAAFFGAGYLLGAIGYRLPLLFGLSVEPLAPLYLSLPGALAGSVLYSAWTGLRRRRQSAVGLVFWGAVGMALVLVLIARRGALLPFLPPAAARGLEDLGPASYRLVCDLSGIVILFSLFLTAWMPLSRRRPPAIGSAAAP